MFKLQVVIIPPSGMAFRTEKSEPGQSAANFQQGNPKLNQMSTPMPNMVINSSYVMPTPFFNNNQFGPQGEANPNVKKFLHITKGTNTLSQVSTEINERFLRLYPSESPLEIYQIQNYEHCDLDPEYTVDMVFDTNNVCRVLTQNEFSEITTPNGKRRLIGDLNHIMKKKRSSSNGRQSSIWSNLSKADETNLSISNTELTIPVPDDSIGNETVIQPPTKSDHLRMPSPIIGQGSPQRITSGMLTAQDQPDLSKFLDDDDDMEVDDTRPSVPSKEDALKNKASNGRSHQKRNVSTISNVPGLSTPLPKSKVNEKLQAEVEPISEVHKPVIHEKLVLTVEPETPTRDNVVGSEQPVKSITPQSSVLQPLKAKSKPKVKLPTTKELLSHALALQNANLKEAQTSKDSEVVQALKKKVEAEFNNSTNQSTTPPTSEPSSIDANITPSNIVTSTRERTRNAKATANVSQKNKSNSKSASNQKHTLGDEDVIEIVEPAEKFQQPPPKKIAVPGSASVPSTKSGKEKDSNESSNKPTASPNGMDVNDPENDIDMLSESSENSDAPISTPSGSDEMEVDPPASSKTQKLSSGSQEKVPSRSLLKNTQNPALPNATVPAKPSAVKPLSVPLKSSAVPQKTITLPSSSSSLDSSSSSDSSSSDSDSDNSSSEGEDEEQKRAPKKPLVVSAPKAQQPINKRQSLPVKVVKIGSPGLTPSSSDLGQTPVPVKSIAVRFPIVEKSNRRKTLPTLSTFVSNTTNNIKKTEAVNITAKESLSQKVNVSSSDSDSDSDSDSETDDSDSDSDSDSEKDSDDESDSSSDDDGKSKSNFASAKSARKVVSGKSQNGTSAAKKRKKNSGFAGLMKDLKK